MKSFEDFVGKIIQGDCIEVMREMPAKSVDMVMFSPAYWGLRDYGSETVTVWGGTPNCEHKWSEFVKPKERGSYGKSSWESPSRNVEVKWKPQKSNFCAKCGAWRGQLGLEPHPQMYINHMVTVCREVRRVLKKTGSLYLNLGDTYGTHTSKRSGQFGKEIKKGFDDVFTRKRTRVGFTPNFVMEKNLLLIPTRVAIALQEDGWILRNDIVWHKPNAMPSSVKDRLTTTWEHIFHFVQARRYYYDLDAIREPHKSDTLYRVRLWKGKDYNIKSPFFGKQACLTEKCAHPKGKNPGDVFRSDSKFLKYDVKTASPGGRGVRTIKEGKLTTFVRQRILDVGAYLKRKLKESGYKTKGLADIIGIKKTTLDHYFRTDFTGQAIPPRPVWEALKPLLKLGNYDDFINEEVRSALPQPHPKGRNPGDFWSICTKPFKGAHFAVYPKEICVKPIKSSCPTQVCRKCGKPRIKTIKPKAELSEDGRIDFDVIWSGCKCNAGFEPGIVLDPMCGSGTTLVVAHKLGCRFIGIELNPDYVEIAKKRLRKLSDKLTKWTG